MEALEVEHKQQESKKAAKKKKKAALKASGIPSGELSDDAVQSSKQTQAQSQLCGCTKCALLQETANSKGSQSPSRASTANGSKAKPLEQSSSPRLVQSVSSVISVTHTLTPGLSQSPRRSLGKLCTGSLSGQSSSTTSLAHSPSSRGLAETGTPDSQSSKHSDDGWEVQHRSRRAPSSDKHSFDSSSSGGASRSSRPPHGAAWQMLQNGTYSNAHQAHSTATGTEVLHLATGPVVYQPPPPPPPPRVPAVVAASKPNVGKPHPVGNAWGTSAKQITANAWASAVHQVLSNLCQISAQLSTCVRGLHIRSGVFACWPVAFSAS